MKIIAFSVPIFKYKVQNWSTKKKQLLDLFNSFEHKVFGNVITSPLDIKTNILSEEIELFKKDTKIELFKKDTKFNLIPTGIWFQQYNHNMNHAVHNHGAIGFSSICFIEYDKKLHKSTTFISPFGDYISGELERYNPDVEEGDIIFFPSNLLHYAPTNLSKLTRIIMSFNLNIDIDHNKGVTYN